MPKQTVLDDNALIYQQRKVQTEKEKLSDMTFKEKRSYLWEYYKVHAAVIIAVLALIIYIVHEIRTPDVKPQLYAAIVNSPIESEAMLNYADNFADYMELNPNTQSVILNDQFYIGNEYGANMQEILTTHIFAGEVDVIIAPESEFKNYAYNGSAAKLSEELPTNVYSALTDYFYLSNTEEDTDQYAYGIYLDQTDLFKDLKYNGESYVLGILPNRPHGDNAVEFIRYLFKNK